MRRGVRRLLVLAALAVVTGTPAAFAQVPRKPAAGPQAKPDQRPAAAPAARAAAARPPADPNDPRMKKVLADWEKKSALIKSLDVIIHRFDHSPAWGDEEFEGRALLQSPNHAWLNFKKVEKDDKGDRKLVAYERIICTGTEVWQYKPDVKQILIFPLDKKNQQKALEEGPLPFLFNMKAAEAEARYEMALANEKKDAWIISVVPRLRVDQDAFSKAFINLRKDSHMPDRIFLFSPDGASTKDFKLSDVKTNEPIAAANFKGVDLGPPWQVVRDPVGNDAVPKGPGQGQGQGQGVAKRQAPVAPGVAQPPRRTAVAPRRPPAN